MRKFYTLFSILLLSSSVLIAQVDDLALSILDKFSTKALNANSVSMKFQLLVEDAVEETENNSEGEIIIKDDTYKLSLPDNIVWFDGEAIYTLVPDVEEVTITEPNPEDEAFLSRPSLLFNMYKKGYKIRLIEERTDASIIDLYPEDLTQEYARIRLIVAKDYTLVGAEYKRKDGITISLTITEYNLKKNYKDSFFKFDEKQYKNVDIIDMRF
ncbi:MAG: outer membrane lipoprotein carrier protein LolA [Bacteroidales bacterium]|nr:outer membrane lipoprotein carrier protein LolA [Bacteroidales bacterium]